MIHSSPEIAINTVGGIEKMEGKTQWGVHTELPTLIVSTFHEVTVSNRKGLLEGMFQKRKIFFRQNFCIKKIIRRGEGSARQA